MSVPFVSAVYSYMAISQTDVVNLYDCLVTPEEVLRTLSLQNFAVESERLSNVTHFQ